MSKRTASMAFVVLFSLTVTGLAAAAARDEHRFKMTFTSKDAKSSTGLRFETNRFAYQPPPAGQPVTNRVTKTAFILERGTKIDTGAVPRCKRSALELNPAACPAGSKVGGGSATILTGLPSFDPVRETVQVFATKGGFLAHLSGLQTVIVELQVVGRKIVAELPRACLPPGTPADNCSTGEAVLTKLVAKVRPRTTRAGRLMTTPRTCPSSGTWTNRVNYTYSNGDTESKTSKSRCRR